MKKTLEYLRHSRWLILLTLPFLHGCVSFSPSASYSIDFNHADWKIYAQEKNNNQIVFTPDGNKVTTKYIGYSAYLGTGFAPEGDTSTVGFGIMSECTEAHTKNTPLKDGYFEVVEATCYPYGVYNINIFVTPWRSSMPFHHALSNLTLTGPNSSYQKEADLQSKEKYPLVSVVSYTRKFSTNEQYSNYYLQYIGLASVTNKQAVKSLLLNAKLKMKN